MNKRDFVKTLTSKMTVDPNVDKQVANDLNIDEGMPQEGISPPTIPPSVAETPLPPSVAETPQPQTDDVYQQTGNLPKADRSEVGKYQQEGEGRQKMDGIN